MFPKFGFVYPVMSSYGVLVWLTQPLFTKLTINILYVVTNEENCQHDWKGTSALVWRFALYSVFITVPYLGQKMPRYFRPEIQKKKRWHFSCKSLVRFPLLLSECFPDSLLHTDILDNLKYLLLLSSNRGKNLHSAVCAKVFWGFLLFEVVWLLQCLREVLFL